MAIESEQIASSGGGAESGSVITYTADTPPDGYLLCDGATLNRVTYADLYAIVGDAFGNGDGATTFQIPDFRGKFLRMTDGATGNDPDAGARVVSGTGGNTGDAVGSSQASGNKNHKHYSGFSTVTTSNNHYYGGLYGNWGVSKWHVKSDSYDSSQFVNRGNTETVGDSVESRPINVNINYMIKY